MVIPDLYSIISPIYDFLIEPFLAPIKKLTTEILQKQFNTLNGVRILEVACGTGSQANSLLCEGFNVFALDKSPGMIMRLHKKIRIQQRNNIFAIRGDMTDIPLASSMADAVIIQLALHELSKESRYRCIAEIKRVTKEHAMFIFVDFIPSNKHTPSNFFILLAELFAGINHYKNGKKFVTTGGLIHFIQHADFKIKKTFLFFHGNLCLAVAFKKN